MPPWSCCAAGEIDYIGMDYLAEVTLSIMMRQKLKDPRLGYATDFIGFIRRVLPEIKERNVRILANAGGLNPRACREKIFEVARELGVSGLRVGVVEGDDIFPRLRELIDGGHALKNMDTGEPLGPTIDQVMSANAYLGARPVCRGPRRRRAHRPLRPDHGHRAGAGAHDPRVRLGRGRLGPSRRRHHRRAHHRVRRPVHRRQLQPLVGGPRPLERRLSRSSRRARTAPSR